MGVVHRKQPCHVPQVDLIYYYFLSLLLSLNKFKTTRFRAKLTVSQVSYRWCARCLPRSDLAFTVSGLEVVALFSAALDPDVLPASDSFYETV